MSRRKFSCELFFDYEGYIDYYSGHGHAFAPEDLIGCIMFGFPIDYTETVGDILDSVLYECNTEIDWLTNDIDLRFAVEDWLTDDVIEEAFWAALSEGVEKDDRFFDVPLEDIEEWLSEDSLDSPYLIGYLHIYLEEDC